MDATMSHAEIIRRRADRTCTLLRNHRDLLNGNGVPVDNAITRIRREAATAVRDGLPAYAAVPSIDRIAGRMVHVADRLTGTRVEGYGQGATITTTSTVSPDGDNLMNLALRIRLDILADRDDDPLFDVR